VVREHPVAAFWFCARSGHCVTGNDLWEVVKLAVVGLLSALGGGGLVRAFGQNRNEASAQTLTLLQELDERNKDLARRIDEQSARAIEQAQVSGENRAKLAYLDLERTMQAQRIEGLADQVLVERRIRELETRTLTGERDLLIGRVTSLEDQVSSCHKVLDKQTLALANQEKMLQELRTIRAVQAANGTTDANTAAVEAQTEATAENTEATRLNTEAHESDA
jgi:hypothetical protein